MDICIKKTQQIEEGGKKRMRNIVELLQGLNQKLIMRPKVTHFQWYRLGM